MHIGFISTRLNGTDGVSLEVEKWAKVLRRLGHELFYCAGELGGYAAGGNLIPQLHFDNQNIIAFSQRAFGEGSMAPKIRAALHFIKSGGAKSIITDSTKLEDKSYGTKITMEYDERDLHKYDKE